MVRGSWSSSSHPPVLAELGLFLLLPLVPTAIGAGGAVAEHVALVLILNLVLLGVGYVITGWALFPMMRWSFGSDLTFTRQLLLVSLFIGLFSGLNFAVQVVTDTAYRDEFIADMTTEIRSALAVRAVYFRRFVGSDVVTTGVQGSDRDRPQGSTGG